MRNKVEPEAAEAANDGREAQFLMEKNEVAFFLWHGKTW